MSAHPDEARELRRLVTDHEVIYEVRRWPTGFAIDLYGTHTRRDAAVSRRPGFEYCEEVWEELHVLAEAVLPPDDRATVVRTEDFRPGLAYDPKRHPRADVELVIAIRDLEGRAAGGAGQRRCGEIVARLRELGVREGTWTKATF